MQREVKEHKDLYNEYVKAQTTYLNKPTSENWENKEKAFDAYNDFMKTQRALKEGKGPL